MLWLAMNTDESFCCSICRSSNVPFLMDDFNKVLHFHARSTSLKISFNFCSDASCYLILYDNPPYHDLIMWHIHSSLCYTWDTNNLLSILHYNNVLWSNPLLQ